MSTIDRLGTLTAFARDLQAERRLDELLQITAEAASKLLGCPRTSIRLLEPRRNKLMAVARSGEPLHENSAEEFSVGEGLMGWIVANEESIRTGDAQEDPRFAPRPGMKERLGSFLGVPIVAGSLCLGVVSAVDPREDAFDGEDEALLLLVASMCAPHLEIARLSRVASVDPLTNTLNRRGMDAAFPEIDAGDREPLCVAMADLDHFKQINDTHGHAVGDQVLRQVGRLLEGVLRRGDAVVRYGGEEFLLILPGVDLTIAGQVAERARASIESSRVKLGGLDIQVTVSLGVAQKRPGETRESLIERADGALYLAKDGGRNRVVLEGGIRSDPADPAPVTSR